MFFLAWESIPLRMFYREIFHTLPGYTGYKDLALTLSEDTTSDPLDLGSLFVDLDGDELNFSIEGLEMVAHAIGGADSQGPADLPVGGNDAGSIDRGDDVVEHLALTGREFVHCGSRSK